MSFKVELDKPYGKEADEAKGFKLSYRDKEGYDKSTIKLEVAISLTEAITIMKEMAEGIQEYRKAIDEKFTASVDEVVQGLKETVDV